MRPDNDQDQRVLSRQQDDTYYNQDSFYSIVSDNQNQLEINQLLAHQSQVMMNQQSLDHQNQLLTHHNQLIDQQNQLICQQNQLICQQNQLMDQQNQLMDQQNQLMDQQNQVSVNQQSQQNIQQSNMSIESISNGQNSRNNQPSITDNIINQSNNYDINQSHNKTINQSNNVINQSNNSFINSSYGIEIQNTNRHSMTQNELDMNIQSQLYQKSHLQSLSNQQSVINCLSSNNNIKKIQHTVTQNKSQIPIQQQQSIQKYLPSSILQYTQYYQQLIQNSKQLIQNSKQDSNNYQEQIEQYIKKQELNNIFNKMAQQFNFQQPNINTMQLQQLPKQAQKQIRKHLIKNDMVIDTQSIKKLHRQDLIMEAKQVSQMSFYLKLKCQQQYNYLSNLFKQNIFNIFSRFKFMSSKQLKQFQTFSKYSDKIKQIIYDFQQNTHISSSTSQQTQIIQKSNPNQQKKYFILNLSGLSEKEKVFKMNDFIKCSWQYLIELDISECNLKQQDWKILCESIHKFKYLIALNLKKNDIQKVTQDQLCKFQTLEYLQHVNIFYNGFNQQTLEMLKKYKLKQKKYTLQYTKTHKVQKDRFPLFNRLGVDKFAAKIHKKVLKALTDFQDLQKFVSDIEKLKEQRRLQQQIIKLVPIIMFSQLKRVMNKKLPEGPDRIDFYAKKQNQEKLNDIQLLGQCYMESLCYDQLYSDQKPTFDQQKVTYRRKILQYLVLDLQEIFTRCKMTDNYTYMKKNIIGYRSLAKIVPYQQKIWLLNKTVIMYSLGQDQQFVRLSEVVLILLRQLLNDLLNIFQVSITEEISNAFSIVQRLLSKSFKKKLNRLKQYIKKKWDRKSSQSNKK